MAVRKKTRMKSGDLPDHHCFSTCGIWVIMVFSSSYYNALNDTGDPYDYLKKDIVWAMLGLGVMLFCAIFDYRIYAKLPRLSWS